MCCQKGFWHKSMSQKPELIVFELFCRGNGMSLAVLSKLPLLCPTCFAGLPAFNGK